MHGSKVNLPTWLINFETFIYSFLQNAVEIIKQSVAQYLHRVILILILPIKTAGGIYQSVMDTT